MATGNELVTFDMVKYMCEKLEGEINALAAVMSVTSWEDVQKAVRSGIASKVFAIGDQLTCQRDNVNLVWDIIGIDHDTPADPQFTHSMTLQLHDCFPTAMQFDAPEALYFCETALEAGTYHFTANSTDYQFTVSADITAGSQLILEFTGSTPAQISVSATVGGAVSGEPIAVTAGSGGTALSVNDINRVMYGSNRYKESAIRQWLNSSAAAGSVWAPQSHFDRPPSWAANTDGFLYGMDSDFVAVLGNVTKVTAKNTVSDGGGYETTSEKIFLLSKSEVYGGNENGVNEGGAYPYYSDYSDLGNTAGTGEDSNRIKYVNETIQWWLTRTPAAGHTHRVRAVDPTGSFGSASVSSRNVVAPACCIV